MGRNGNQLSPGRKSGGSVSVTYNFKTSYTEHILPATNSAAHPYCIQRSTKRPTEMVFQSSISNGSKPTAYYNSKNVVQFNEHTISLLCLFVFLALQLTVVFFYSPVAGFSLLVFEVS
jgi:hypothetical protein